MGVHGLWRLIEPSGKPVPLETLENKTLAVDVSIWLHQAVKGFQDSKGAPVANAHLLGIYHRLCKLLYFKIKPVFVFDGSMPALKQQTIAKRNQQKHKTQNKAERLHKNLLESILKHSALSKVLSEKTKAEITTHTSPIKNSSRKGVEENLYFLPPAAKSQSEEEEFSPSESEEESPSKHWDLHTIDTESAEFKSLPVDVRHEILTDLKETRKQNSWGRLHELPTQSDDFSVFQMRRLLKRQSVQEALEKAEQEMGGHSLSLAELEKLMNDQGVITENITGSRIASDENTRYLLIKDLKKAVEEAKRLETIQETEDHIEESPGEKNKADVELESDLQKAIALSLMDAPSTSKTDPVNIPEEEKSKRPLSFLSNFDDYDWTSSEDEEFEVVQEFSSAQSYMKEYSGLTPHEIEKIISGKNKIKTTKSKEVTVDKTKTVQSPGEEKGKIQEPVIIEVLDEMQKVPEEIQAIAEESDSSGDDFIEIEAEESNGMEVVIKPDEQPEDDLFADIFQETEETPKSPESEMTNQKSPNEIPTVIIDEGVPKEAVEDDEPVLESQPEVSEVAKTKPNEDQVQELEKVPQTVPELTVETMEEMQDELRKEQLQLEKEKSNKERLAGNITDQMSQETQELLQLFGVPYVLAPTEAEAQCAFLELINLTDGTITEDSDIWLFGGRTVYKNFFNQGKQVLEFRSENIERNFRLSREQLILFAMLVGSDYTVGLTGVGPVTALEILAAFPGQTNLLLSGLSEFRQWFDQGKLPGPRRTSLRGKLKNLAILENFPNPQIASAYLQPRVETSEERFTWNSPDVPGLVDFARRKFGWTNKKTEEILNPVLRKLQEKNSQTTIRDYFKTTLKVHSDEVESKMSKRVKSAVKRIGTEPSTSEEPKEPKPRKVRRKNATTPENEDEDAKVLKEVKAKSKKKVKEIEDEVQREIERTTSKKQVNDLTERLHRKEVIPQRQKDKTDLLKNKLKAIETFRKSKKGPGFMKKRAKVQKLSKEDAGYLSASSSDD